MIEDRDPVGAGKIFRRVLQLNPNHLSAFNYLGMCHRTLGQIDDAIQCFDQALAIDPKYPYAIQNRKEAIDQKRKDKGFFTGGCLETNDINIMSQKDLPNNRFQQMLVPRAAEGKRWDLTKRIKDKTSNGSILDRHNNHSNCRSAWVTGHAIAYNRRHRRQGHLFQTATNPYCARKTPTFSIWSATST